MLAVIFEVEPYEEGKAEYLQIASDLRERLKEIDGFISIERFQSLSDSKKVISLSFWRDEDSIAQWRNLMEHRHAQARGKKNLFSAYRIRVGQIVRDYSAEDRAQAPKDSKENLDSL